MTIKKFRIRKIDTTIEQQILIGMITSTVFCRDITPMIDYEYFQISYATKIARWCQEYYEKYREAPNKNIKAIYESEQQYLKETESSLIEQFLQNLSSKYAEEENEKKFNSAYLLDKAIEYFRERGLAVTASKTQLLLEAGKVDEAQEVIQNYRQVAKVISNWVDPFEINYVDKAFDSKVIGEDSEDVIFSFAGDLGKLIGPLERGWLIGFLAPMKRGKCVCKGSLVLLSDGRLKLVEDIFRDKDTELVTLSADGKFTAGNIAHHWDNGGKPCFLVTTRTGREVRITGNHPLLTVNGWMELDRIKEGDYIAAPRKYDVFGSKKLPKHKIKLLAYLIADGGLTGRGITFSKKELAIKNDFESAVILMGDMVTKNDQITSSVVRNGKGCRFGKTSRTSFTSVWLDDINLRRCLSKEKVLPDIIFELNKLNLSLFLSTLFTCDGSIWKDRNQVNIEYSSASKVLLYQINHLLLRFGIIGRVRHNRSKCGKFQSWSLSIQDKVNLLQFLGEIGFRFGKNEKAKEWLPLINSKKDGRGFIDVVPSGFVEKYIKPPLLAFRGTREENLERISLLENVRQSLKRGYCLSRWVVGKIAALTKNWYLIQFVESNIFWDKIVSIENIGYQQTYDLAVDKYHNFVADDMLVHNTWYLQETALQAAMARLNVVMVSLEMGDKGLANRIYHRLTALGATKEGYIYPCFDCKYNQDDSCSKPERINKVKMQFSEDKKKPRFEALPNYKPCAVCRGTKSFSVSNWYEVIKRDAISLRKVKKQIKGFTEMHGHGLRIKAYPAYSANLSTIKRDIDILEYADGFVPDVIVIDYADILSPESKYSEGRERTDETWKALKNLAATRHCLVVTASQSNRATLNSKNVRAIDTAEDIRKIAHVDAMYALNQTSDEKREGAMRVGCVTHRWQEFDEGKHVMVLQQLTLGQVVLDSCF